MNTHAGIPLSGDIALDLHLQPKQWVAFDTPATEVLFGGAAFGGKSHLMRVAAILWCSEIAGLQVYLFRRIRDDLVKNHMEGPKGFRALLAPWTSTGICRIVENEIRFWNGSKIYLCHCEHETDIYKYQGVESHVLLIDELTHWTESMYRFLRNRVRMVGITLPKQYEGRFPRILCGANPGNIGHLWVKRTFIEGEQPLKIRLMPAAEGGMLRQFIPARLEDNEIGVHDDPDYEARLEGLGSATLVAAMRWGDWDVVEGAFFDCWQHRKHVIAPFAVPKDWVRFRSADWGSASPGSVGWWAVVQDDYSLQSETDRSAEIHETTVDGEGKLAPGHNVLGTRLLPRGALVRYREDYIASGPGKGLKLTAEQVADRIIEREKDDPRLAYAVLDPSTFKEEGGPSIAERINGKLVKAKLPAFRKADNARVTKIAGHGSGPMSGWDIVRQRMIGTGTADDPHPTIFWFSTCFDSIRTIPALQHDPAQPEDIAKNAEDHCFSSDTLVRTSAGLYSFAELMGKTGLVRSHDGEWHRFRSVRLIKHDQEMVRLNFSDGAEIRCTSDHQFLTARGWMAASNLLGSAILSLSQTQPKNLTARDIISVEAATIEDRAASFIALFGLPTMAQSRRGGMSITKIVTATTMQLQILTACLRTLINPASMGPKLALEGVSISSALARLLVSGTDLRKELLGIASIMRSIAPPLSTLKSRKYAKPATQHLMDDQGTAIDFARMPASRDGAEHLEWMMRSAFVLNAEKASLPINIANRSVAPTAAVASTALALGPICSGVNETSRADVYCFTVPDTGNFEMANGMIAAQCADDARYACLSRPWLKTKLAPEPVKDAYRPPGEEIPSSNFKVL
jgi:hypothetical protein